ncbi:DUF1496 domain-containing protein [Vibrio marisflavi]|uniref:DUF1496 domain-containing protein n=1 Tax=Vibrio marisflavi CECT 7928 TaxID=634439 RepID=A0ABM9A4B5_9VIBR|nr:DUF1496 domain-containing protein [Vibrio marisflavi]CAH0539475.1 hypothetical protein VMF7928_02173 [Vibrio marisflavi CECT 7928]
MNKALITFMVAALSLPSLAEVITLPKQSSRGAVVVNNEDAKFRVCYYQDKAYSLGAILQVGDYYMICHPANNFETNGALKWVRYNPQQKAPAQTQ